MKQVLTTVYEKGDHVLIKSGSYKNMVGIVDYCHQDEYEIDVPEVNDYIYAETEELEFLTKEQADKINKNRKFLRVDTLDETITIYNNKLEEGCQSISFADANKIADFIKEHCKVTPKKKPSVKKKPAAKKRNK